MKNLVEEHFLKLIQIEWAPGTLEIFARVGVEDTRLKAKDSLFEDRPSRGQGKECSRPRPRTQAQLFSKKIFFQAISKKRVFKKIFASARVT